MGTDVDLVAPPDALRAVAEPLRWRIVALLGREELCVCHLVEALDAPQSLVSHHLRALRKAGVVETERHRYWTYYRLRPEALEELGRQLVELGRGAPAPGTTRRPCC
jgi:ArsR family transcriptional regulator